jgi:peptidoglycan/LPS O-acetylase OafA/YrhL
MHVQIVSVSSVVTNRQPHLDSLRGIAALIVVLEHYFAAFYPYTIFGERGEYRQIAQWENFAFYPPFGTFIAGHFAVCLFFILSGYVLSRPFLGERGGASDLVAAIVRRPIRLGGLVVFTIVAAFELTHAGLFYHQEVADITASKPWLASFVTERVPLNALARDLFSPFQSGRTYNPPLWTIQIELYGSIATFVFLLLFRASAQRRAMLIALVVLLTPSFYQAFALGVLLADIKKQGNLSSSSPRLLLALTGAVVYFSSFPQQCSPDCLSRTVYAWLPAITTDGGYPMLGAATLLVVVLASGRAQALLDRPAFLWLGRMSYAVYAIHFLVLGSMSSWLFLRWLDLSTYGLAFLVALASGMAITLLLAYGLTVTIDTWSIAAARHAGVAVKVMYARVARWWITIWESMVRSRPPTTHVVEASAARAFRLSRKQR